MNFMSIISNKSTAFFQRFLLLQPKQPPPVTKRTITASSTTRRRRIQPRTTRGKKDLEQPHFPYGLKPVDFSKPPPVIPTLIPPPNKRGLVWRTFVPISIAGFFGFGGYLYFNSDDDMEDYWNRVDSGANIMADDDDDDDDDFDEDEE